MQDVNGRRGGVATWILVVLVLGLVGGAVVLRRPTADEAALERAVAAIERGDVGRGCGGLETVAACYSPAGEAAVARLEELMAASLLAGKAGGRGSLAGVVAVGASLCSAHALRGGLKEKAAPLGERLLTLATARRAEDPVGALGLVMVCATFLRDRRSELLQLTSLVTADALALSREETLRLCGLVLDRVEVVMGAGSLSEAGPGADGLRSARLGVARAAALDAAAAVVRVVEERIERSETPLPSRDSDEGRLLAGLVDRLELVTALGPELAALVAVFRFRLGDEARARALLARVGDHPAVTPGGLVVAARTARKLRLLDLARTWCGRARERATAEDDVRDAVIELRLLQAAEAEATGR